MAYQICNEQFQLRKSLFTTYYREIQSLYRDVKESAVYLAMAIISKSESLLPKVYFLIALHRGERSVRLSFMFVIVLFRKYIITVSDRREALVFTLSTLLF